MYIEIVNFFKKVQMIQFTKIVNKYPVLIGILLSIIIFTIIYHQLGTQNFNPPQKVGWVEALYFSASVQSLLGLSDITPKTRITKIFVILQVLITIILTFLFSISTSLM